MNFIFRVAACAGLLLQFTGCGQNLRSGATPSGSGSRSAFQVYPEAETSANPRIPCIPPVSRPGRGKYMDVEGIFRYRLAPFVLFPKGGTLRAEVHDSARREARDLLVLEDGDARLALRIDTTSNGKKPLLVYSKGKKDVVMAAFSKPLDLEWRTVNLHWATSKAELTLPDGESVSVEVPDSFDPKTVSLQIDAIDELQLQGEGSFALGWENNYAATVTPRAGGQDIVINLFGFDTYFISRSPEKRDFPLIQVLNGAAAERAKTIKFSLHGEITGTTANWSQEIHVPGVSSAWEPIRFPAALPDDVYHLSANSDGWVKNIHYVSVTDRADEERVPKFGLHDSNRRLFGFWPDALPIDLAHVYLRYAYVRGPAWLCDPGITADTPSTEWNWNPLLDWSIRQGLTPYVCLGSQPDADWMREKEYEAKKMKFFTWGKIGGIPKLNYYRSFLRVVAERYKGKVTHYEVDNEPNVYMGGVLPSDYVPISQAVAEEIHAVDPQAKVYGICGTGSFISWMTEVFKAGGAKGLDGISVHTYATPRMPEAAQLPEKLAEAKEVIRQYTGQQLPLLNSETGTYVALREEVDRPLSPERLEELIQAGTPNLYVNVWPNRAMDERSGSISVVRNAVYNFLAGSEYYTFFGWNKEWPVSNWWTEKGEGCFSIISATKDGERTPSWHTLTIGELSMQLKAAIHKQGKPIQDNGVAGGIFPKQGGGEVAVLWSPQGKRSILIESADSTLEKVSLFGKREMLGRESDAKMIRIEIDENPIYLHARKVGLRLLPSPVIGVGQEPSGGFHFTLVNRSDKSWTGSVTFSTPQGWKTTPVEVPFKLEKNTRTTAQVVCVIPQDTPKGTYKIEGSLRLPDGTPFTFPASIEVRPKLRIPLVAQTFEWTKPAAWEAVMPVFRIDQPDQVVVGRSPLLASLQEDKYWGGPDELSAQTRFATDGHNLYIWAEVTDAFKKNPRIWPGVHGSCVEVFLDQRLSHEGLGMATYSPGVSQFLVKPADGAQPAEIVQASEKFGKITGISVSGGNLTSGKYWVALRIPRVNSEENLGIDIGINGPTKDGESRKSQLMLFGTAQNSSNTSGFGSASVPPVKP